MENRKIAVIGAGPSGLSALRAFHLLQESGTKIPNITCFEKQSTMGGLWNYSWRTGTDEHGYPVHNSMYHDLRMNAPKECYEYAAYTYMEHFGKPVSSYPPRAVSVSVQLDYVTGYAQKCNLDRFIQFNTIVQWVTFDEKTRKFTVTYKKLGKTPNTEESMTDTFDNLIVCVGHFSTPNIPAFPDIDQFQGQIMHSHDFRDGNILKGRKVLLIGAKFSGDDLTQLCLKFGAQHAVLSYHKHPSGLTWPKDQPVEELPCVKEFTKTGATFMVTSIDLKHRRKHQNGEHRDFDLVIMCTGYKLHFPFLAADLALNTHNTYCPPLYKGIFKNSNPQLMYLGMQYQAFSFTMFEQQAFYARDVIMGRIALPSIEHRQAHTQACMAKDVIDGDVYEQINFQTDYCKDLQKYLGADCRTFDLDKANGVFKEWVANKLSNVLTWRDQRHASVVTGTLSAARDVPWMRDFDDNYDSFV